MNSSTRLPILLLGASLVAGGVGGFASSRLLSDGTASEQPPASASASSARPLEHQTKSEALSSLREQVNALQAQNAMLGKRLRAIETSAPGGPSRRPVGEFASRDEVEELRRTLAQLTVKPPAPSSTSPHFKEQVAETLSTIRHEEAVARVKEQQDARAARLEHDVAQLSEKLALSPYQSGEMRTALSAQYEREDELVRRWEEGEDPQALGLTKRTDRETFRQDVERFLSAEQAESFWTTLEDRRK